MWIVDTDITCVISGLVFECYHSVTKFDYVFDELNFSTSTFKKPMYKYRYILNNGSSIKSAIVIIVNIHHF